MEKQIDIRMENGTGETVSPLMFGTNIEHTRSCVHQGLSAQMLRNRKFAGKPVATSGHAREWYPIGENIIFCFDAPYTRHHEIYHMTRRNERNSQRIVNVHEGKLCGIGQHELFVQQNHVYQFRMVVKTSAPVRITAALTSRFGHQEYASQCVEVTQKEWTTFEIKLKSSKMDQDADLRITFSQKASVCFGAFSLLPDEHFHGMRRDVIDCLKETGIRLLRWPGGNFAGEYNWLDGLLPVDMRAPFASCLDIETQPSSMGFDFHEINTDDFILLCREIGAEPFITINPCWNTPEENAAWVEYCNGDASTPYGKIRAERGHAEPYQVKLWSLGNEFGYGHMEGENTPEGYCRIARENAEKMLAVSGDLRLCSSGHYPNSEWAQKSAAPLQDVAGLASQHFYAHLPLYPDAENFKQEYDLCVGDVLTLQAQIRQNRRDLPENVRISMDEWNVWYAWNRPSNVMDGIFAARTLHMLFSEAEPCGIEQACHFEAINEGIIYVAPDYACLTAQGQVFALMKHHIGGEILCRGIDTFATRQNGTICLTVVNALYDQPQTIHIAHDKRVVEARLYTSDTVIPPSLFEEKPLQMERTENGYLCTLPAHSVAMIRLEA